MNFLPFAVHSSVETWAQLAVGRVIHSLPEGLLIAVFAWTALRILPRQNSRTRFAVWFVALVAVAGLACLGDVAVQGSSAFSRAVDFVSPQVSELHLAAHWAAYLFLAWGVIAFVGLLRLAMGLWHLRQVRKSCTQVNVWELDPAVAAVIQELNASQSWGARTVTLATSKELRVPSALGLWSPVIALPHWAFAELPASELAVILRHEFAHVRRWDDWTNLIQKIVRAVLFFHPAVWWIESRLSVEREMACDDVVVAETDNPMGYANCLVNLLERSLAQRGWTMAQAIVHRAREASERLTRILDKNRPTASGLSKPALGLVGTFAALCAVMLPATPQFVAFDRASEGSVEQYASTLPRGVRVHDAAYRTSRPAAVIPAGFVGETAKPRARTSSAQTSLDRTSLADGSVRAVSVAPGSAMRVNSQSASARGREAEDLEPSRSTSGDSLAEVNVPAGESAGQEAGQPGARVVLVRETQVMTAEIPVPELTIVSLPHGPVMIWTVKMMRVTMLAPVWREMQMPPAKKI
ncbi:MAG: M56 family metallopeptidase [Terriglobales bacterium]